MLIISHRILYIIFILNHQERVKKNTSLISKRSISLRERPADLTAAGIATAGPIPITAGSTPTAEKLLHAFPKRKINSKI